MNELLQELIEFVKQASPILWSIYVRQVYVEAGEKLAWAMLFVILSFVCLKISRYISSVVLSAPDRGLGQDDQMAMVVVTKVAAGVSAVVAFGLMILVVKEIANPDFYAIRIILNQLR